MHRSKIYWLAAATLLTVVSAANAETGEVRIGQAYGTCSVSMFLVQKDKLIEKYVTAAGLPAPKVTFTFEQGGGVGVDGILSGNLDIADLGNTQGYVLWDKTAATANPIKIMMPLCDQTEDLMTTDPNLHSADDFKDTDRIAMPSPINSIYANVLQMYAANKFGWDQRAHYDNMAVPMGHPDAMAAILSKKGEVRSHFTIAPYTILELKGGARKILDGFAVTGRTNEVVLSATTKWKNDNPKTYAAVVAAFNEANAVLRKDPRMAAQTEIEGEHITNISVDDLASYIGDLSYLEYQTVPHATQTWADFLYKSGLMKNKLSSWKDVFFDNNYTLDGN